MPTRTGRRRAWARGMGVGLALCLAICLGMERTALAAPACHLPVYLGVQSGALTMEETEGVRDEVRRVWEPYGVRIQWRTGHGPHVPGTLSITILEALNPTHVATTYDTVAVAWILFEPGGSPLPLIRASTRAAERIATFARIGGRDVTALPPVSQRAFVVFALGRSIAHEIGHYLLASRTHSPFGLMRRMIPPDDYFLDRSKLFALTRDDLELLARSPIWQACASTAVESTR